MAATITGHFVAPESLGDPPISFRLRVEFGTSVVAWFTEVSGLGAERQVEPVHEGGQNTLVHQLPKGLTYGRVTLKRGIGDLALWNWFATGLYDCKVEKKAVTIVLWSTDRTKSKRFELKDCIPVKWSGAELRADSNQVAIESLELVHHGLEVKDWA